MKAILTYAAFVGLALAVGAFGGLATATSVSTWYVELVKPFWTPPNWVFAPVWTTLYVLMGIAAGLVLRSGKENAAHPLSLFLVQLFVNLVWSLVFFGLHDPWGALIAVAVLWGLILWMTVWFWKYSKAAAILVVPYLLWVTYASTLNLGIALLNPS